MEYGTIQLEPWMVSRRRVSRRISGENRPSNIQLIKDSEQCAPFAAKNMKHTCSCEQNLESVHVLERKVKSVVVLASRMRRCASSGK
jgi:hypothetical protein